MTLEVERVDGEYTASVRPPTLREPWETERPLSRRVLHRALVRRGVHVIDVIEAIDAADRFYELGVTDRVRHWRQMRRRFEDGQWTEDDFAQVIDELRAPSSVVLKSYFIGILELAGPSPTTIQLLTDIALSGTDDRTVDGALRTLSAIDPSSFADLENGCLRQTGWQSPEVRGWAITYAGSVLSRLNHEQLFQTVASIAIDGEASAAEKKDARVALALLAGLDIEHAAHTAIESLSSRESFLPIVERAHARMSGTDPSHRSG